MEGPARGCTVSSGSPFLALRPLARRDRTWGQKGYPIVALSFQRDRNVHGGIIHVNQRDRNSGGEI